LRAICRGPLDYPGGDLHRQSSTAQFPKALPIEDCTCAECVRLWLALAKAAKAYVKILRCCKRLAIQPNCADFAVAKMEELRGAAQCRRRARRALKKHDAAHRAKRQGGVSNNLRLKAALKKQSNFFEST
jgi:hypothetical protein